MGMFGLFKALIKVQVRYDYFGDGVSYIFCVHACSYECMPACVCVVGVHARFV